MKRCILIGLFLGLILSVLQSGVVLAQVSEPDSVDLDDIVITTNMTENQDFCCVARYELNYGTPPDEAADETFIFKFLDSDNETVLGMALPVPFDNDGYGQGCVSFYFDSASAPTWGDDYYIAISGNPAHFAESYEVVFSITESNYSSSTERDDARDDLYDAVMTIAEELEIAWDEELIDSTDIGMVLSAVGERYFRRAIRGLQSMCPELFLVQVENLDYTPRSWTTTFADLLANRFNGTWVQTSFNGLAGLLDTEVQTAWGFVTAILCVVAMGFSYKQFKQVYPGFLDACVVMVVMTGLGAFSMTFHGLIAFFCAFITGMVLFLNRA